MSHSSSLLDLMTETQADKSATFNALLDAASPSTLGGRRASACSLLTWAYYGGQILVDGVPTAVANGTLSLSANSTCYVEMTRAGAISFNTSGFTAGRLPLYTIVTGASTVTSYTDHRLPHRFFHGRFVQAMADANQVLTAAAARCDTIETTGALTAQRDLVVPAVAARYTIRNRCTGNGVNVRTAGGAGVVVAATKTAIVECDGTDCFRVTADA